LFNLVEFEVEFVGMGLGAAEFLAVVHEQGGNRNSLFRVKGQHVVVQDRYRLLKEDLRQIWLQPNKETAERVFTDWVNRAQATGITSLDDHPKPDRSCATIPDSLRATDRKIARLDTESPRTYSKPVLRNPAPKKCAQMKGLPLRKGNDDDEC